MVSIMWRVMFIFSPRIQRCRVSYAGSFKRPRHTPVKAVGLSDGYTVIAQSGEQHSAIERKE